MMNTTSPNRGDVVRVAFRYNARITGEMPAVKRRPCVVLSSKKFHSGRDDVIVAAVTSNEERAALPGDTHVSHWREAGLRRPSVATMVIRTIYRENLLDTLGRLQADDLERIDEGLRVALGL
jgi:mRNA interferase MazF